MNNDMKRSVAVYAVADDGYVPKAVMALRSFQRSHAGFGYFVLGTKADMSRESLELMRRYAIELIDVDEAHRFVSERKKHSKIRNPFGPEVYYPLKGPELLAERGFTFSIGVDGDVLAPRAFDLEELGDMLERTDGYGARPVGTLSRTLKNNAWNLGFRPSTIREALGLKRWNMRRRYEPQAGVIYWNNIAMAELGLFEKCARIFQECQGCFTGDQDLLAFAAATYDIPVLEIGHPYNYGFFEDSPWVDKTLRRHLDRGEFGGVYVIHYVFAKPWLPLKSPTPVKVHFINAWRKFVQQELGGEASEFFEDLSPVGLSS